MEFFMRRNIILRVLNTALVVFFINQAATAIFLDYLPGWAFNIFHRGGGAVLLSLIFVHVILNINWFRVSFFSR